MAYIANALARRDGRWTGQEVDLVACGDLDEVTDVLHDLGADREPVLLLVEEDDEWFGVVRLDPTGELRAFISDIRVIERSEIAILLFEDAPAAAPPEDEEEERMRPDGDPAGDPALLDDLGTPAAALLELCAEEGLLPSDVIAALCEKAGCLDCLEELRGA